MCLKCKVLSGWNTSKEADTNESKSVKAPFDVNHRACYTVAKLGLGRESLATCYGIMCMPLLSEILANSCESSE